MASKEELEVAIKVAKDLLHTEYAEQLEKKLKELSIPKEEREFLKMFTCWIANNNLHMKSDDKMAEMIFDYLKENWYFKLPNQEQSEGWTYFSWDTIPEQTLISVMNSGLHIFKDKKEMAIASVIAPDAEKWHERSISEVRTWGPYRVIKTDVTLGSVNHWYQKLVKGVDLA